MDFYQMNLLFHTESTDHEHSLSHEALEYQPKLTLYQMSSITLVTTLWRQKRIQRELLPFASDFKMMRTANNSKTWLKIVNNVASDIETLNIPKSVYHRLLQISGHVGKTLLQWLVLTNEILCRQVDSTNNSVKYMNHVVWTQHGHINEAETARSLLRVDQLSDDDKFLIVCNHCLETEIYEIGQKILYPHFLKEKNFKFKKWPMLHYWIAIITNNSRDLVYRSSMFNRALNLHFDVEKFTFVSCTADGYLRLSAIKYLWSKLKVQDKVVFASVCICATGSVELTYYFLNQLDVEHRRKILNNNYLVLLKNLMVHWLWQDYFINIINLFWDIIRLDDFLALCRNSVNEMKSQSQDPYRSRIFHQIYLDLWQNMPKHIENAMYRNANSIASVLKVIPWEVDVVTVRQVISNIDESMKKQVITSELGRKACLYFANHLQWDFYDLYTTSMLSNKQDLFQFKETLIQETGLSLAVHFIRNRGWEHEKEFFQWFFPTIKNKKFPVRYFINHGHWDLLDIYVDLTFADKNEFYVVKSALIKEEGLHFAENLIKNRGLEAEKDFMKWFFENESKANETNKRLLNQYIADKLCFLYPDSSDIITYFLNWSMEPSRDLDTALLDEENVALLRETIITFVNELKLMQADNLLNWYFRKDKQRILQFKTTFIMNTAHDWISFAFSLLKRDPEMHLLRNFTRWCFPEGNAGPFKDLLLNSFILRKLLYSFEFQLADEFVDWCVDSDPDRVVEFKNTMFVASEKSNLVNLYLYSDTCNEEKLKKILIWFKPSPTAIEVFKSTFAEERYNLVHQLLDEIGVSL